MQQYLPTGNQMVSLPKINEATAGIEDFTFLSMGHKGMIDVRGTEEAPLIRPFVTINGAECPLTGLSWRRDRYWIPVLTADAGDEHLEMTILSPIHERGFAVRLRMVPSRDLELCWGLRGTWDGTFHCVNEDKPLEGTAHCYESHWNRSLMFDYRMGAPLFAFAPMSKTEIRSQYEAEASGISYRLAADKTCTAGRPCELTVYWGLGFEEVAAATAAQEMLRRGWDWEYEKTVRWLDARITRMPTLKTAELYHTNLFFSIFYSTGITLDTEETVCATSRSTRYYVSAAYWDRDTLLWAFPAILDADPELAREILFYVFGRQRRNLGTHSRYIDGTVLEPGFELDELMAPVLALEAYEKQTGDAALLAEPDVRRGIEKILKDLSRARHPEIALYETFLQPTDDLNVYPYLTYDNVLVWKALRALAELLPERYAGLAGEAEAVRKAVSEHCVFRTEEGAPYFAWSVDLQGRHNIYDEPPGSLQLLPYYGFCSMEDPVWKNTVAMIRSPEYRFSFAGSPIAEIGCEHAPYPWILSLCNSLLCGHEAQAFRELELVEMDNGIACESVDPVTGTSTTGDAFATCAGFLCHSMRLAAEKLLR